MFPLIEAAVHRFSVELVYGSLDDGISGVGSFVLDDLGQLDIPALIADLQHLYGYSELQAWKTIADILCEI